MEYENFYRDTQENFTIKTNTGEFNVRLFFPDLCHTLQSNLWYFVRGFVSIIGERWKRIFALNNAKIRPKECVLVKHLEIL